MNSAEIFSRRAGMTLAGVAASCDKPIALAIGVFDGVHLGHRKLLNAVAQAAERLDAVPVALTFDPHPRAVLFPSAPPVLLTDLAERVRLLNSCNMQMTAVVDFTSGFAAVEPVDFLDLLLKQLPRLAVVGVGSSWRFGKNGSGNVELLKKYAAGHNIELIAVPELELDGDVVSASRIRRLIAGGNLDEAEKLLGYRYCLCGTVSNGYGIAGSNLNCPTANIEPAAGVLPPDGVYSGIVTVEGKRFGAAVNIGVAPTYNRSADLRRRIEAHLLDFSGNLYGRNVRLELGGYLRSEQCFASEEALKKQIFADVEKIRSWINGKL